MITHLGRPSNQRLPRLYQADNVQHRVAVVVPDPGTQAVEGLPVLPFPELSRFVPEAYLRPKARRAARECIFPDSKELDNDSHGQHDDQWVDEGGEEKMVLTATLEAEVAPASASHVIASQDQLNDELMDAQCQSS